MGNITLRATWIMPINHVGRFYALAFTRDVFTISFSTIAFYQGLKYIEYNTI
jgi:hypothetical protein